MKLLRTSWNRVDRYLMVQNVLESYRLTAFLSVFRAFSTWSETINLKQ